MDDRRTYSEQMAKRVLSRAIELDHIRGPCYTRDELRGIAAELGVSDAAFDQALHEVVPAIPVEELSRRRRIRGALAAAAGTVVGAATGIIDVTTYFVAGPLAMAVLMMLSGGMAVLTDHWAPGRGFIRFQTKNAVLWLCYAATWAIAASSVDAGPVAEVVMVRTVTLGWAISSAFGALISAFHAWRRRSASTEELAGSTPLRRRIADRLKKWIDLWAERVIVQTDHRPQPHDAAGDAV